MQMFTGKQYLAIDIANNFGLDKKDWSERLDWFATNVKHLESLQNKAAEPALYYAGVQAYRKAEKGIPSGYPISLDATASGMQFLACLTGDRSAAQLCNVLDTGHRRDAYTAVFEIMVDLLVKRLGEDAAGKIERDDLKQAVMTSLYGSTAMPKKIFGEGSEQLQTFYDVMEQVAPAAWELNQAFMSIWDSEALTNDWVMPDNFHVHIKVMGQKTETVNFMNEPVEIVRTVNMTTEEGRSLGANTIHSLDGMVVREMTRRCNYDPKVIARVWALFGTGEMILGGKTRIVMWSYEDEQMTKTLWRHYEESGYLSARILDYLTPLTLKYVRKEVIIELLNSLPAKPFSIISVHDCFRCLPNYGNDLRKQYNLQLHLIAKSNLLSFLLSQLMKKPVQIDKFDETVADDILNAEYALS
jgi:hypothetical protein